MELSDKIYAFIKGLLIGFAGLSVVVVSMLATWAWNEAGYLILFIPSFISAPSPAKAIITFHALIMLLVRILSVLGFDFDLAVPA